MSNIRSVTGDYRDDVEPSGTDGGTGLKIGDGYTLTAGHVVFEWNRRRSSTLTLNDILDASNTIPTGGDLRGYRAAYLAAVSLLPTTGTRTPNTAIETGLVAKDMVIINGGGNVGKSDQGLVTFVNPSDMTNLSGIFDSSVSIWRNGNTTHTVTGSVASVGSRGGGTFEFTGVADLGDSGAPYFLTFGGVNYVIGSHSSQIGHLDSTKTHVIPTGNAIGEYFSFDEWSAINLLFEASQSGNVTQFEPTNMLIGSTGGDSKTGSYRADIMLGREGQDILDDGDQSGDAVWADDQLYGGAEDDTLKAGRGDDLLHGGDFRSYAGAARTTLEDDGSDTVDYAALTATDPDKGIRVSLLDHASATPDPGISQTFKTALDPSKTATDIIGDFGHAIFVTDLGRDVATDTLISVEMINGTSAVDTLEIKSLAASILAGPDKKGGLYSIDLKGGSTSTIIGDTIDLSELKEAAKVDLRNSANSSLGLGGFVAAVADGNRGLLVANAERVMGTAYKDDIIGSDVANELVGGGENDRLVGDGGDDIFWGGEIGDETNLSGEMDKVDYSSGSNAITVSFDGSGVMPVLTVKDGTGGTDTLHSIEQIIGTSQRDYFQYKGDIALGYSLTIDAGTGQTGPGNDILNLNGSSTGFLLNVTAGTLTSTNAGGTINLVNFHTGIIGSEYDDTIIDLSSGPKTIDGGEGNNDITVGGSGARVMGRSGDDVIQGGDGSDALIGGGGRDQISGGAGNDWIDVSRSSDGLAEGGAGDDVIDVTDSDTLAIKFAQGDGHDSIIGRHVNTDPEGNTQDDTYVGFDLTSISSGDCTLVWNYEIAYAREYDDGHHRGIYYLRGEAALVVNSTGDSIYLGMITGEAIGWRGDNLPHVQPDDIPQYIIDDSYNVNSISIAFADVSFPQSGLGGLTVVQSSPDAYNIAPGEFAADPVNGPGSTNGTAGNDALMAGNGGGAIDAGSGDDTIYGGYGAYTVDGGSGHDVYDAFGAWADYDVTRDGTIIVLTNRTGFEGEVRLSNVEEVFFDTDLVSLSIADILATASTAGNDTITGTALDDTLRGQAGNDQLFGQAGNDILSGDAGSDTLTGGGGDDVYRFATGDGQDIVNDYGNGSGGSGGADSIELASEVLPSDVTVSQANNGANFVLAFAGSSDRITISSAILYEQYRIEQVRFADGTSWSYADLLAKSTTPTTGNDVFYGDESAQTLQGGAGNDRLFGRLGDDTLIGGTGNDMLNGAAGSDTYIFGLGDGNDVIEDVRNLTSINTLQLGAGIDPGNTIVSASGLDIVIGFTGSTDTVNLSYMAISSGNGIDRIRFDDGTVWNYNDIMAALPSLRTTTDATQRSAEPEEPLENCSESLPAAMLAFEADFTPGRIAKMPVTSLPAFEAPGALSRLSGRDAARLAESIASFSPTSAFAVHGLDRGESGDAGFLFTEPRQVTMTPYI